jgi:hypothetical protein
VVKALANIILADLEGDRKEIIACDMIKGSNKDVDLPHIEENFGVDKQ